MFQKTFDLISRLECLTIYKEAQGTRNFFKYLFQTEREQNRFLLKYEVSILDTLVFYF